MAAGAWKLYTKAIKKIGGTTINLPGAVRMVLVKSTSNFGTTTLSLLGSLTNQVTEANGYSTSGEALLAEAWTISGTAVKFDASVTTPTWTASGGDITSIKGAVLFMSGASAGACHLLCYASLSTSIFSVTSGNTLTVVPATAGIFAAGNGTLT